MDVRNDRSSLLVHAEHRPLRVNSREEIALKNLALSAVAVALAGSLLAAPAAEARPGYRGGHGYHGGGLCLRGGYRGYGHRRGPGVGGALAAGAALGIIGGAIAASQAPRYYEPAPAYGYAPALLTGTATTATDSARGPCRKGHPTPLFASGD